MRITNTAAGPRGAKLRGGGTFYVEPGETVDIDAVEPLYSGLVIEGDPLDHDENGKKGGRKPADPPALSGKSKAELLEIAVAEGVEIEDGATNEDIRSAIELHRETAAQD